MGLCRNLPSGWPSSEGGAAPVALPWHRPKANPGEEAAHLRGRRRHEANKPKSVIGPPDGYRVIFLWLSKQFRPAARQQNETAWDSNDRFWLTKKCDRQNGGCGSRKGWSEANGQQRWRRLRGRRGGSNRQATRAREERPGEGRRTRGTPPRDEDKSEGMGTARGLSAADRPPSASDWPAKGSGRCGPFFLKAKAQKMPAVAPARCPSQEVPVGANWGNMFHTRLP